jgi:hypothetical protein
VRQRGLIGVEEHIGTAIYLGRLAVGSHEAKTAREGGQRGSNDTPWASVARHMPSCTAVARQLDTFGDHTWQSGAARGLEFQGCFCSVYDTSHLFSLIIL